MRRRLALTVALLLVTATAPPLPAAAAASPPAAGTPSLENTLGAGTATDPGDDVSQTSTVAVGAGISGPARPATSNVLRVVYELELIPDEPGRIRTTIVATIPSTITRLTLDVPDSARIAAGVGFDQADSGDVLEWDGRTVRPTVTYTVAVDERTETFDGLRYVDTGQWALVNLDTIDPHLNWWYAGDAPESVTSFTVVGPGYAGQEIAYLGEHEVSSRTTEGQTFNLIVPAGTELRATREEVLAMLTTASEQLRVRAHRETVNVFVGRDPLRTSGGFAGESDGTAGLWVHRANRIDDADNTWIHEYVHSRQDYEHDPGVDWTREAFPEYYEALLTYRQDRISFEAFWHEVATDSHSTAELARPDSWSTPMVPYSKGKRVMAALDARIREESDGQRTLQYVFRRMNEADGKVTYDQFKQYLTEAAGVDLEPWVDRYVAGPGVPPIPKSPTSFGGPESADSDGDGLSNHREVQRGTDPFDADADGDGLDDGPEVNDHGTDPTDADTDSDGLEEGREVVSGSDPADVDTDDDGLYDGLEVNHYGSDPTDADTDGDGLDDYLEVNDYGTDPADADTDGDGYDDAAEEEVGTDPTSVTGSIGYWLAWLASALGL